MLSTSSKVAFGYLILIGLLLGSIKYIYKQMNLLTERNETELRINDRRQTTHKIISKLYEIEVISQTLHTGKASEFRNFNQKMKEVQLSIDSLQAQLTDSLQYHRLDTLRALLRYKNNNVKAVTKALQRMTADELYQQQFDSLLTQQDSLLNNSHVRRRVITHQNTYTIHHKPKGFFKRVADVFSPEKADSTQVNNVIQEVVVDTLEDTYSPIDTIANLLTDLQTKVLETRQKELRTIDAHVNRLRLAGSDLSKRVNQLLETIEQEEQEAALKKIHQERDIRNRAAWTMATISILAVVLVLAFFTIIWRDLTRSNHYRKELEKAKLYAENLLVAREKLMLTITHDIKAPAGSIIGYLDLLNRLVTDKRQLFYLSNMQSAAHHLLNLVTSLLDFHRLEAGKMDLNPITFKPYQLLEDIYHCFLPLAQKKQLELKRCLDFSADLTLEGDPFRLRQIVENLLSNALKFTPTGSITLESNYQGNQFIVRVSDTGCGMTHEEQERIFHEFTRLHSAQGQEGFGLGLSITRKLIDLQHGKIHVNSIPHVGSTFEVSIPLPSLRKPQDSKDSRETNQNWNPENKTINILAIDDDNIQLQLTTAMLHRILDGNTSHPTNIQPSQHPEEILELIQHHEANYYDILLTDIQMPAMNGFELLKAIRELPEKKGNKMAVIAITARGDMDEKEFREKGFAGMLQKPFNLSDLQKVLAQFIASEHQETHETDGQTPAQPTQQTFNFAPLLAFTDGDEEAAHEILTTFVQETERHIQLIKRDITMKDFQHLCEIGHKMLPTFTMMEASEAIAALQWLDSHRGADFNTTDEQSHTLGDEAIQKAQIIVRHAQAAINQVKSC